MSVSVEYCEGVAILMLQRPPINALDLATLRAVETAALELSQEEIAGLVLTGSGAAFCAGVDVRAFASYGGDDRAELVRTINRMLHTLCSLPFPLVSAVNGHAMGGGFVLMLTGDIRLATDAAGARLGLQEAKAGIPFPVGALEVIRSELSPGMLRRLCLTSMPVTTAEMQAAGVIDYLYPAGDLLSAAVEQARVLAAQPAFRAVKAQVREPLRARLEEVACTGADPLAAQLASE